MMDGEYSSLETHSGHPSPGTVASSQLWQVAVTLAGRNHLPRIYLSGKHVNSTESPSSRKRLGTAVKKAHERLAFVLLDELVLTILVDKSGNVKADSSHPC